MPYLLKKVFARKEAMPLLLASMLAMASIGVIYIWSVFIIPLENEFHWSRKDISLVFTLSMLFLSVGIFTGGFLNVRLGVKKVALCALVAGPLSLLAASYGQSLWPMCVFYGVLASGFMGIVYNTIIYVCNLWFDRASASVSGLLQTCLGLSPIAFSMLAANLLQAYDWRVVFRVMCLILAGSLLVFFYFAKEPAGGALTSQNSLAGQPAVGGLHWRQMLKSRDFWFFWLMRLIIVGGGVGVIGHAVPMALEHGLAGDKAVLALGMLSFANAMGRVGCGLIWDVAGFRKTLLACCLLFITSFLLLAFTSHQHSESLAFLAFCLNGAAYGSINLAGVAFTRLFFGMKHFSENYGITVTPLILASFVGPYLMGGVKVSTQSYYACFFIFAFLGLLGFLLVLLIGRPKDWGGG